MLVLKPSGIHGVGVFTTSPLRVGTDLRLWPRGDWRTVPSKSVRGALLRYCVDAGTGKLCRPTNPHRMSVGWYLNHSDAPNVDCEAWRVRRYVRAGQELTINYDVLEGRTPAHQRPKDGTEL